jgi:hypothetical protein
LVGWALSTSNASAMWPHWLHHHCCNNACRPYNAFSPAPCPTHGCPGYCMAPFCGGGVCPPPIQSCLPTVCGSDCCGEASGSTFMPSTSLPPYAASGPAMMIPAPSYQQPPMGVPMGNTPNFVPPQPTPNAVYNNTSMRYAPPAPYGVQPAGYNPGYNPNSPVNTYPTNYYPVNNYPMVPAVPVPSYWYSGQ